MLYMTLLWLRTPYARLHAGPTLGYMEPKLGYKALMASYMRLSLRYTEPALGYMRPLLSYTRRMLPHVEAHKALGTQRNPRNSNHVRSQTLSKHKYID